MINVNDINSYIVKFSPIVGFLLLASIIVIHVFRYIKVRKKEKKILELQDEINKLENNPRDHPYTLQLLRSGQINQSVFEKLVEKKTKSITADINKLKLERQFTLDKLPFFSLFKK